MIRLFRPSNDRNPLFRLVSTGWLRTLWRYTQGVLLVLLALAISYPVHFVIEAVNLVMLFLAAVVLAAAFLGRGPAILVSVLSVLVFDFFLVEPRLSLSVANSQYLLTFFGLLTVGLIISTTVAQLRTQVEIIRQREAHTAALNSLSQDLTGVVKLDEMLGSVVEHISRTFDSRVVILLPNERQLHLAADSQVVVPTTLPTLKPSDLEAAWQIYQQTDTALQAPLQGNMQFLALRTSLGPVGVMGIHPGPGLHTLANEGQRNLLQGFANLAALAIERARLAEQASQAQVLKNIERLQSALLSSISHELRTPLVTITGALSALAEDSLEDLIESAPGSFRDSGKQDVLSQAGISLQDNRKELVDTAYEEARRLNLLVGNLLDMSRLESGALRLSREPCDPQDLIGIALQQFGERRRDRVVITSLMDNLPLIDVDVPLMVEVLLNLLENAAKYSPKDGSIDLICRPIEHTLQIEVGDHGNGVPPEDLEHIFDKFYRSSQVGHIAGLGLGLSISKGIVEAHEGRISAYNRPSRGLSIVISLPIPDRESWNGR